MAKKKTSAKSTKTRQRPKKPLPIKASKKKSAVVNKKPKQVTSKVKKPTVKKAVRKIPKKVIIRQYRVPLGPKAHLLIQLRRTKTTAKKPKASKSIFASAYAGLATRLKKAPFALPLIVIGLLGTVYFSTDVFRTTPQLTVYSPPAPTVQQYPTPKVKPVTLSKSEPVSLNIPDVGISTSLSTVGKQQDNTLEVPVSAEIPGWYRLSPTPGELGPSIIVGHVDSPKGPAVFWRLRELTAGQIIEVKRADNTTAKFKITEILQFEQNNFPTEKVYGNIEHAGLRLITCGGTFNRITQQYSHNTVVFASLIE